MNEIAEFIDRVLSHCEVTGASESTVSRKLLGNGIRLSELQQGKSLRVDTLERAKALLSEMESVAEANAA